MEQQQQRHLHIAVLTQGSVRWELCNFLLQRVNDRAGRQIPFSVVFYEGRTMIGRPVTSNRNRIVRDRPTGSDLLMIDADVIPHSDIFEVAMQGKDVVICPTPIWRGNAPEESPVKINLQTKDEETHISLGADEYIEILDGGTGAIYISHEVLDHPEMRHPFRFITDDDGVTVYGEDYYFCDKARELGFKIWSANRMLCQHMQEVDMLTIMRRFYSARAQWESKAEVSQ